MNYLKNTIFCAALFALSSNPLSFLNAENPTSKSVSESAEQTTTDEETEWSEDKELVLPLAKRDPLAGKKMMEKYKDLFPENYENGVHSATVTPGSGAAPEYGSVIYFMLRAYDANGAELALGDSNHSHPENTEMKHGHPDAGYKARWTIFGAGGGTFSLGVPELENHLFDVVADMQEMGTSIVYISSENAYGSDGYEGHEFSVAPNTDLLLKITLMRVRHVAMPENIGFVESKSDQKSTMTNTE